MSDDFDVYNWLEYAHQARKLLVKADKTLATVAETNQFLAEAQVWATLAQAAAAAACSPV
jgi:hypothetical protein